MLRPCSAALICVLLALGCQPGNTPSGAGYQEEAEAFLNDYTTRYLELYGEASEAEWQANTRIVEGDDSNRLKAEAAQQALADFTGSTENIERAAQLKEYGDTLTPLQLRQLDAVFYQAGNFPQVAKDLVAERISSETFNNEKLFGFEFTLDGSPVTTNDLDDLLEKSNDLGRRQAAWEASKEVGRPLKAGLADMVRLRNGTVQAVGYEDYFDYQVSDYGMGTGEMMDLLEGFIHDIWPLYRELHTWARYELAATYGEEVPDLLPAHWLPNRWAQDWAASVKVEGIDLDSVLADKEPEWLVKQGEEFFVSLGFDPLPASFYEKSSLYPAPAGAGYKKNNHASAWHMDLRNDLRSLMSVQSNQRWWATTHHELGHIYYYQAYSIPEVPHLLRAGANRAFHEGVGTMLGMAATHKAFLVGRGLIDESAESDEIQALLREALDSVVFIPFAAGTMSHFERDLYAGGLPPEEYNQRWWDYVLQYQGVVPPSGRGEEFCDPCTKTHIINDAAQYYDYALSYAILHQIHAHIANNILHQDPRNTNYYGSKEVGTFLRSFLSLGATRDWRQVLVESVGEDFSAKAMLNYFEPLMGYLQQQNEDRSHTLPELSG